jgi:hypothetical protein
MFDGMPEGFKSLGVFELLAVLVRQCHCSKTELSRAISNMEEKFTIGISGVPFEVALQRLRSKWRRYPRSCTGVCHHFFYLGMEGCGNLNPG